MDLEWIEVSGGTCRYGAAERRITRFTEPRGWSDVVAVLDRWGQ